jgi:hypothetical protein
MRAKDLTAGGVRETMPRVTSQVISQPFYRAAPLEHDLAGPALAAGGPTFLET